MSAKHKKESLPKKNSTKTESRKASKKHAGTDAKSVLTLSWNVHDLPSSQHRAGLAGLALSVAFLERKHDCKGVCAIESIDGNALTLSVDRDGMQSLFDDVYDANLEETLSKAKWAGSEPKSVREIEVKDEKTDRVKREKRFVYDRVMPAGALVRDWDSAPSGSPKLWLKLWQDMIWSTLRGVPATREPFNARAERRAIDDGGETWDELATRPDRSVELPSTYALGAQAKSAENVAFADITRLRFLLHFWPLVAAIYVPAVLQRDGKREFVGYALAIPDVAALDNFVASWERVARGRGSAAAGYVPRDAVIDLAAEAGLDVVRRTSEVVATKQGAVSTQSTISGVDVFHIEKEGNNLRLRGLTRVIPERKQDDEYKFVRNANYWSPVFRRQRISNVLESKPWWHGFARLCSTTSDEMTIHHQAFQHDCRLALTEVEMKQDVPETEQTLEHLIYRRVQAYLRGKMKRKYDLVWKQVEGKPADEKDYREKREKIVREAFLAVRSRTGADFVAYFTATLCSIPQSTNEEKYLELARALIDRNRSEEVRSLTLLALSSVPH